MKTLIFRELSTLQPYSTRYDVRVNTAAALLHGHKGEKVAKQYKETRERKDES